MPADTTTAAPAATPTTSTPHTEPQTGQASPSTQPQASGGEAKTSPFNDAFSEIDKIIADSQQKRPDKPQAKSTEKKTIKQVEPDETKTEEAPEAQPEKTETKAAEKPDESQTLKAPELRAAYSNLKKTHKEAVTKLEAAEKRLVELEEKAGLSAEAEKLQQRLELAEKRSKELEDQIRFVDYQKSDEYKEKYHTPFLNAYQTGRNKIASLRVMERKNDLDEVVQEARKATPEDFDAIMRISDDAQAAELADKLFGPMANLVIYHREKVIDLNTARNNAIEEYQKKGSEREEVTKRMRSESQKKVQGVFKKAVEEGIKKYPQWFKAADDDAQGKEMLEKGLQKADSIFTSKNVPPEELAQAHAAFRNMAGAFPFVALKLHRAEAKITELQAELEQFKKSTPSEPSRERGNGNGILSFDDEIDALSKARR